MPASRSRGEKAQKQEQRKHNADDADKLGRSAPGKDGGAAPRHKMTAAKEKVSREMMELLKSSSMHVGKDNGNGEDGRAVARTRQRGTTRELQDVVAEVDKENCSGDRGRKGKSEPPLPVGFAAAEAGASGSKRNAQEASTGVTGSKRLKTASGRAVQLADVKAHGSQADCAAPRPARAQPGAQDNPRSATLHPKQDNQQEKSMAPLAPKHAKASGAGKAEPSAAQRQPLSEPMRPAQDAGPSAAGQSGAYPDKSTKAAKKPRNSRRQTLQDTVEADGHSGASRAEPGPSQKAATGIEVPPERPIRKRGKSAGAALISAPGKVAASEGRDAGAGPRTTSGAAAASQPSEAAAAAVSQPSEAARGQQGTRQQPAAENGLRREQPDTAAEAAHASPRHQAGGSLAMAPPANPQSDAVVLVSSGGVVAAVPTSQTDAAALALRKEAVAGPAVPEPGDRGAGQPAGALALVPAVAAVASASARALPGTGTTPVKPFVPVSLPRLDDVGQQERGAVVELQRQLSQLRGMYEEVKAAKIENLEKALAEQAAHAEERVQQVEQRARLWQAAAEHAESKAKAAGSQELAAKIESLETQLEELLNDKGELLLRIARQERELAQAQQETHDLRARLAMTQQAVQDMVQQDHGVAQAGGDLGHASKEGDEREDGCVREQDEADGGSRDGDRNGMQEDGPDAEHAEAEASMQEADGGVTPPAALIPHNKQQPAGRGVGMQFPTPSPGVGVQFPTPGLHLMRLQGLLGSVLSAPNSTSRSPGRGISTECQRAVQMLPTLRAPTPSIQSRQASGAVPLATQAEAARAAGLGTATVAEPSVAHGGATVDGKQGLAEKSRRSTGSPIDGICANGQRRVGVNLESDVSYAHGMGAPEGFLLRAPQQDRNSFGFHPNPTSARKANRLGLSEGTRALAAGTNAAAITDAAGLTSDGETHQGPANRAPSRTTAAAVIAAAAAPLPASPGVAGFFQGRHATLLPGPGGGAHADAFSRRSPVSMQPTGSPEVGRQSAQAPAGARDAAARQLSPDFMAQVALAAAGGMVHSGTSVVSNQDSCTISNLVARAQALLQRDEHFAAPQRAPEQQAQQQRQRVPEQQPQHPPALQAVMSPVAHAAPVEPAHAEEPVQGHADEAHPGAPVPTADKAQAPTPPHGKAAATCVGAGPLQRTPLSSPSPRTAKLNMYESTMPWHIDILSRRPEVCRVTHRATGFTFELRETDLDDEELDGELAAGEAEGQAQDKRSAPFFLYTPLEMGTAEASLPSYLQEPIQIPAAARTKLMDALHVAVKTAPAAEPGP